MIYDVLGDYPALQLGEWALSAAILEIQRKGYVKRHGLRDLVGPEGHGVIGERRGNKSQWFHHHEMVPPRHERDQESLNPAIFGFACVASSGYSIRRRFSINLPRGADWENQYEPRVLDRRNSIVGGYAAKFWQPISLQRLHRRHGHRPPTFLPRRCSAGRDSISASTAVTGFGQSSWSNPVFDAPTGNFNTSGFLLGGTLGANYQIGSFVIGLRATATGTTLTAPHTVRAGVGCTTQGEWLATVRGRAGFAWDRVLFYGTGGAAFGNVETWSGGLPYASVDPNWLDGRCRRRMGLSAELDREGRIPIR